MECFYSDPTLETGDILVLVEWLDSFSEEVASWGAEDIPVFVEAKQRLLDQFDMVCSVGERREFADTIILSSDLLLRRE